jgi:hypothetical protein
MHIGFVFWGVAYGIPDPSKGLKDFRHCWPYHQEMLIEPFLTQGHRVSTYVSTYPLNCAETEKQLHEFIKPVRVCYSEYQGSDPFTCKGAAFNSFENDDLDFIILTRMDLHFYKKLALENIDYNKFNFLYPEGGRGESFWWEILRFTTDNVYLWPHRLTQQVKYALLDTYRSLRPDKTDTHPLIHKLLLNIGPDQIHFLSNTPEPSDQSSYYTLCPRRWEPLQ